MRALRILVILAVILGGLFVIADRVAVGFAEDEAASRLRSSEGLSSTPSVSISGFPFLTQVFGGELDGVKVGIKDFEASTAGTSAAADGTGSPVKIRIDDLNAEMRGVTFSSDYSSAAAASATGSAGIAYDELLRAAKPEPVQVTSGVTAKVTGLSDGGNGKIKVAVEVTVGDQSSQVSVLSSVKVEGDTVEVRADSIPSLGIQLAEDKVRQITDFKQEIDGLPGGIKLDQVKAAKNGVEISVKGSDVRLVG